MPWASIVYNVVVRQRVDDVLAVALELHETDLLERAQLVRDGALRGADELSEVGDAQLLAHERVQHLDARRVAEHLEQVGEVVEQLLVRQVLGRTAGCELVGFMGHGESLSLDDMLLRSTHMCPLSSYEHSFIFLSTLII